MFTVITKIPVPPDSGNMYSGFGDIYIETEQPDESNNWKGVIKRAIEILGVDIALSLRLQNFKIGEILVLDVNDRDMWTRKPSKWLVETEDFDTFEEAFERAKAVIEEYNNALYATKS